MRASEYVGLLRALIQEHGDLECVDTHDDQIAPPELVDEVFVLADTA